jgi:hypothetical protein
MTTFAPQSPPGHFDLRNTFIGYNRINNLLIPFKAFDNQQAALNKNNLSLYKKK